MSKKIYLTEGQIKYIISEAKPVTMKNNKQRTEGVPSFVDNIYKILSFDKYIKNIYASKGFDRIEGDISVRLGGKAYTPNKDVNALLTKNGVSVLNELYKEGINNKDDKRKLDSIRLNAIETIEDGENIFVNEDAKTTGLNLFSMGSKIKGLGSFQPMTVKNPYYNDYSIFNQNILQRLSTDTDINTIKIKGDNNDSDFVKKGHIKNINTSTEGLIDKANQVNDNFAKKMRTIISYVSNALDSVEYKKQLGDEKSKRLKTQLNFLRNYSDKNLIDIYIQLRRNGVENPTMVFGEGTWNEIFGFNIIQGERDNGAVIVVPVDRTDTGLRIQQPRTALDQQRIHAFITRNNKGEKIDSVNDIESRRKANLKDYNSFGLAQVYDVTQVVADKNKTQPIPLSKLLKILNQAIKWFDNSGRSNKTIKTLSQAALNAINELGLPVNREKINGGAQGFAHKINNGADAEIVLPADDKINSKFFSTLIHEFAHCILDINYQNKAEKLKQFGQEYLDYTTNRPFMEQRAESVAYIVSRVFGLNLKTSLNYMGCWDLQPAGVKNLFDGIADVANFIIEQIKIQLQTIKNAEDLANKANVDVTGEEAAVIISTETVGGNNDVQEKYEEATVQAKAPSFNYVDDNAYSDKNEPYQASVPQGDNNPTPNLNYVDDEETTEK